MPIQFLIDENLRGVLSKAIERHNLSSGYPLDVVRVGDVHELPLGTKDPENPVLGGKRKSNPDHGRSKNDATALGRILENERLLAGNFVLAAAYDHFRRTRISRVNLQRLRS